MTAMAVDNGLSGNIHFGMVILKNDYTMNNCYYEL